MVQPGGIGGPARLAVVLLLLALLLPTVPPLPAPARAQPADYDLDVFFGAHFYTQANGGAGASGYAVSNADDIPFLTFFHRIGGVEAVGYPISHRFLREDRVLQAFQKVVFEWHAEVGAVYFINTLDALHDADLDELLRTVRGVPPSADWSSDAAMPFDRVVLGHLQLLDASPAIKAAYFAERDALSRHGLPMAPVQDMGGVLVLRAQRTVFQQWLSDRPWARADQVTILNGGDLAKELGLFPPAAVTPLPASVAPLSVAHWTLELPTATPTAAPPTPVPTPAPTPTPSGPCYGDEEITFWPPAPLPGQEVHIAVSSARRSTGVGLNGAFGPVYLGVYPGGKGWFWSWRIRPQGVGQFGYEFTVGGSACAASSVRVGPGQPAQLMLRPPLLPPFLPFPAQE